MEYTAIKNLALAYADREDVEVINNIDNMLYMVESNINTRLQIGDMTERATLPMDSEREYYCLPPDFRGMRTIQTYKLDETTGKKPLGSTQNLAYLTPEQINTLSGAVVCPFYTIINEQLLVRPTLDDGAIVEIVYYRKIPHLSALAPNNWISDEYADLYVTGLTMEISDFVKDQEASQLWRGRFDDAVARIKRADWNERWSGNAPMLMRTL